MSDALDAIGERPVFVWCEAREQRVSTTVCNRCGRCELTTGKDGRLMAEAKICDISGEIIRGNEPKAPGFDDCPGVFLKTFGNVSDKADVEVLVRINHKPKEDGKPGATMTDVHPDAGKKVVGKALAEAMKVLGYRKPREKKAPATAKKGKKKTQAPPEWTLGLAPEPGEKGEKA
ncbi:MAG: hypothetical protein ABIJ95_01910 [Pseudomonadota bacterium]